MLFLHLYFIHLYFVSPVFCFHLCRCFKHLCKIQGLTLLLTKLSQQYFIVAFLKAFLERLIPLACASAAVEAYSNTEGMLAFLRAFSNAEL